MKAGMLDHITTLMYEDISRDTPVYVSKVNSNEMHKVVGVQVKKSFADNGEEKNWVEILYSENSEVEK